MSELRFIRLAEVKDRTGLSKTEIYRRITEGTFPRPVPLGKRSVGWRSDELDTWFTERIAEAQRARSRSPFGRGPAIPRPRAGP